MRARTDRTPGHGPKGTCWIWTGPLDAYGYGQMRLTGRAMCKMHRFSYESVNGMIPDGKQVNHNCHVRNCVNPDHLYVGTQQENMADMLRAGRHAPSELTRHLGEAHGMRKLSAADVKIIRSRYAAGGISQRALGKEFGVSNQLVSMVVRRKIWDFVG